jgi:hypothetical protein
MRCAQKVLTPVRTCRHSGTARHKNLHTHEECTYANHINLRFRILGLVSEHQSPLHRSHTMPSPCGVKVALKLAGRLTKIVRSGD